MKLPLSRLEFDPNTTKSPSWSKLYTTKRIIPFIMQLYQLHTVEEFATWQWLCDHINILVIIRNLQHLDFSTLDYLFDEMRPHIDVLSPLMIGWILRHMYDILTITFNNNNPILKFQLLSKTFKPQCFFTTLVMTIYSVSVVDNAITFWSAAF